MFKLVTLVGALAAAATLVVAPVSNASAAKSDTVSGLRCVAKGVRFLIDNDLLILAAKQQVDYDTIDSDSGGSEGLINTDLPSPSFLPLGTVIRLHYTNPELFDWCQR